MLLNSLDLSLEEVKHRVGEYGGLTIPSHFNKGSFSLISQLGLIPEELELEALEVSRQNKGQNQTGSAAASRSIPTIISSDAHRLEDIGSAYTQFFLAEASLEELRLAFRCQRGRRIAGKVDGGVTLL
jgi:PHP family Zn ribbon phosphoesterase